MTRARNIIEKMAGKINPVRPNPTKPKEWQYAADTPCDKEPTSWRSIISKPTMKNVRANTGNGHKDE